MELEYQVMNDIYKKKFQSGPKLKFYTVIKPESLYTSEYISSMNLGENKQNKMGEKSLKS